VLPGIRLRLFVIPIEYVTRRASSTPAKDGQSVSLHLVRIAASGRLSIGGESPRAYEALVGPDWDTIPIPGAELGHVPRRENGHGRSVAGSNN
jgi:hypothetical protein